jgi:hypothetical protein
MGLARDRNGDHAIQRASALNGLSCSRFAWNAIDRL